MIKIKLDRKKSGFKISELVNHSNGDLDNRTVSAWFKNNTLNADTLSRLLEAVRAAYGPDKQISDFLTVEVIMTEIEEIVYLLNIGKFDDASVKLNDYTNELGSLYNDISRLEKQPEVLGKLFYDISGAYLRLGQLDSALDYAFRAIATYSNNEVSLSKNGELPPIGYKKKYFRELADSSYLAGKIETQQGNFGNDKERCQSEGKVGARDYFQYALDTLRICFIEGVAKRELRDTIAEAKYMYAYANTFNSQGRITDALTIFHLAYSLLEDVEKQAQVNQRSKSKFDEDAQKEVEQIKARLYSGMSFAHYNLDLPEIAIKYLEEARQIYDGHQDERNRGYILCDLASALSKQSKLAPYKATSEEKSQSGVIRLAEEAISNASKIAKDLDDKKLQAWVACTRGYIFKIKANYYPDRAYKLYTDSYKSFKTAQEMFVECGLQHGLAIATVGLGRTYRKQKDYQNAESCFRKSLKKFEGMESIRSIRHIYVFLARVAQDSERWQDAEEYYIKTLSERGQVTSKAARDNNLDAPDFTESYYDWDRTEGSAYLGLAICLMHKDSSKHFVQAYNYYLKALAVFRGLNHIYMQATTEEKIGDLWVSQNYSKRAWNSYLAAEQSFSIVCSPKSKELKSVNSKRLNLGDL